MGPNILVAWLDKTSKDTPAEIKSSGRASASKGRLKEKSMLQRAPLINESIASEKTLIVAPVCEYRNTTNEHKEQIKLAPKTTFFLTTNAPAKLKVTPVAATPSSLSIIKRAAMEAFPVSFHAITENKKTSNHLATLVRKPARNKIVKALVFQISNKTRIFIKQKGD